CAGLRACAAFRDPRSCPPLRPRPVGFGKAETEEGAILDNQDRGRDDQAPRGEIQDRPPYGAECLGPPEESRQPPRIWSRPTRPAPQGQALRLWRAIARQAEAARLLRKYLRAAVPRYLCGSDPHEGRFRRAHDCAARAPARRHDLSGEARAHGVRRPPVHQPRPHQGERQARDDPELSGKGRRRHRGEGPIEATGDRARGRRPGRARRTRLYRGRPLENDGEAHAHSAVQRGALPRADGAAPRGRVLFALTGERARPEIAIVLVASRLGERAPQTLAGLFALVTAGAKSAHIAGVENVPLPVVKPALTSIAAFGDTGCRLKAANRPAAPDDDEDLGKFQDCNVPARWPFARL